MNLLEKIIIKKYQKFFKNLLILFLILIFFICSAYIYFSSFSNERVYVYEVNDVISDEIVKIQICKDLVINNSELIPDINKNISISYSYKFLDLIPNLNNFMYWKSHRNMGQRGGAWILSFFNCRK